MSEMRVERETEFHCTKDELIHLAKYWAEKAIELEYRWFLRADVDCSEIPHHLSAWARVGKIRDLLGNEVDTAIQEVYQNYFAKYAEEAWQNFLYSYESEGLWQTIQQRR